MKFTRRSVIRATAATLAAPALGALGAGTFAGRAAAQARTWKHGLSLFGELKYPQGFKHFDYVNPNAPQGGVVRQVAFGTFDNFNSVVAGVKGSLAMGTELFNETLTTSALDEVSTEYGLLAEAVSHPDDHSSVTYRLRANARWHDGKPVTPDDVIFSFEAFKANSPQLGAYYRHVVKAEKTGEREITFTFDGPGNRELPQIVGQLPVLPKHWWEGTDKSGKKRDVTQTTLEPPLGSGPYRLKDFAPGRSIVYEKVADYWGKDLNVAIGTRNFQQLRFEYFRDSTVALEAFKGDQVDWRTENSAKNWATAYDFPAVRDKRVVLEEFPIRNFGVMQAFVFNIRRDKFKDARVRRAFNFAFDFEEMNKQIFFGQYKRIASYFEGTELASSGLPRRQGAGNSAKPCATRCRRTCSRKPYTNPVGGNQQAMRNNLREALALFRDAGYEIRNTKLVNAKTGEPFGVEFLVDDPATERFVLFYKPSLERVGMTVNVRVVDSAQYENRLRQWDLRHHRRVLGPVAVARQRAARLLEFAGRRSARLAQPDRHQESGDRYADRARHLHQGPRRPGRRHQGARPRAAVEFLRRAAMDLRQGAHGALGPLRPSRTSCRNTEAAAFPTIWWWDADKAAKVPQRS